jgi:hypothetical protein
VWREGELHGEWIPAVKDCVNCFRLWLSDCAACTGRASWTLVPDPLMFFVARTFNSCARMARVGTHEDHGTRDLIAHDAAYTQMHTHAHTSIEHAKGRWHSHGYGLNGNVIFTPPIIKDLHGVSPMMNSEAYRPPIRGSPRARTG